MQTQDIYSILKSGSLDQIRSLIENAPPSSFKDITLSMAESGNRSNLILGLTSMIMEYCEGKDPEYGAKLAEAAHQLAFEIYNDRDDHGGFFPTTLSNLASQHLNALNYLGRSEELIAVADTYLPIYKDMGEMENYPSLAVAKANALFNLNNIDESYALLDALDCTLSPGSQIGKARLLERIQALTGDVTTIEAKAESTSLRKTMLDALNVTDTSVLGENQEIFEQLKHALADEDKHYSLDPNKIDHYERLLNILDSGEDMLTKGGTADSELTMRKISREATSIFHPGSPVPATQDQIQDSLSRLKEVYDWAKTNNSKELLTDAIWGIYLCHSRLDCSSEAADALIELRTFLEAQRAGITDPIKRGGAFSTYPQLFNVLCERLSKSGRYFELLESIEASKGRAIADILTLKQDKPVPDADVYGAVSNLKSLTQAHQFNYLSFYLDRYDSKAIIYMVMICKDGETYGTNPVSIDEKLLDSALANLDPGRWNQPGFRGSKIPNASIVMAPLASLISDLNDRGVLQEGDHICYTADEQLNNLPLHYLPFEDGLLIDSFSFSRIHNAAQLETLLEEAPVNPNHAEVFVVPTIQDTESANWPDFEESINRPATMLSEFLEVQVLKDQQVSLSTLNNYNLPQAILHFSTHGVSEIGTNNPFTGSGLVISDGDQLPDQDKIANGDLTCVLTPQKIVDSDLDLHNSHVSLMACVSGLSREGLGGDALGLDWALVNAGARSMLTSHWYISARQAADFFDRFYHFWLGEKQTKAKAFQNTIHELQQSSDIDNRHQWSAFSLSGDWR
ncbi:MAG: CHAT domain-containing protein [Gammaproteobacteria bacterium]|nr:CHAT domain-containing protein [Gammaproteobacteria bacterium]